MKRVALFLPALLILIVDQLTKAWVLTALPEGQSVPVVADVFHFTHVQNSGTAFGLLRGNGALLTVVTVAAIVFIVGYWVHLLRLHGRVSPVLLAGLALPLGGAFGNLADRVRYGHVVDFLDFRVWPVFNVADMAITTGAALVAYYFFAVQDESQAFRRSGVPQSGVQAGSTRFAGTRSGVQAFEADSSSNTPTPDTLSSRAPESVSPERPNA